MLKIKKLDSPENQLEEVSNLFKALADPSRLRILNLLALHGEMCNCHIEMITAYKNSKISRHFAYLKNADLIQSRRDGLWVYYSLKPAKDVINKQIHIILEMMPSLYAVLREDLAQLKTLNRCETLEPIDP